MKIGEHVRQGDVLIRKIETIPANVKEIPREHGAVVLARGEKTGHLHRFTNKGVCSFTTLDNDDVEFLLVNGGSGATLKHELVSGAKAEHKPISAKIIDDGAYEQAAQVEHAPEPIRVSD